EWWRGVDLLGRTRKVVVFKLAEIGALSRKEISSEEDPTRLLGVSKRLNSFSTRIKVPDVTVPRLLSTPT
ncbi:MAG: hypothetical protein V3T78_07425, partial [Dehalococcoidia bacterium]